MRIGLYCVLRVDASFFQLSKIVLVSQLSTLLLTENQLQIKIVRIGWQKFHSKEIVDQNRKLGRLHLIIQQSY